MKAQDSSYNTAMPYIKDMRAHLELKGVHVKGITNLKLQDPRKSMRQQL